MRKSNNKLRAVIIADDLTGAADAALQFAQLGANCLVQLEPGSGPSSVEVVVWNSDSRALAPAAAERQVGEFARFLPADGSVAVFKKVDSTLRGNIGAEVQALMDTGRFGAAVIAPAYPQSGRTTVKGVHYVQGEPVGNTEFASDISGPSSSCLVDVVGQQMREDVEHLTSACSLRETLTKLGGSTRIFAVDAGSVEDLDAIAACAGVTNKPILWVGSAGLAHAIGMAMDAFSGAGRLVPRPPSRRPLVVIGSRNSAAQRQLQVLKTHRTVRTYIIDDSNVCVPPQTDDRPLEPGEVLLVHTRQARDGKTIDAHSSEEMAVHLAEKALALAKIYQADGLVAAGGDTARELCRLWGIEQLQLQDRISEGVPLAIALPQGLPIVTKAGGFGEDTVLIEALEHLEQGGELNDR